MNDEQIDQLVEIKYKANDLVKAVDNLCHAYSVFQSDLYQTYPRAVKEECAVLGDIAEVKCKLLLEELKQAILLAKLNLA